MLNVFVTSVFQITAVMKLEEKVVKNVNLLLKPLLGWQKAMLFELQQISAYNITED